MLRVGTEDGAYVSRYGFKNGLPHIKEVGYYGIDYQEFVDTETDLFKTDFNGFKSALLNDKKLCEDNGLVIYQTHGPWRWPPMDNTPENRAERFEKMAKSIEGTAILGCKNFVIHPIMPFTTEDKGHEKETLELNLEFFTKLTNVAKENDVIICYENMPMPGLSISTPADILEFAKTINSKNFKVCLDTGHVAVYGEQPGKAVRLIGKEYLKTLHIHDNNGAQDLHWNPFTGVIDWEDFGKALFEIGFDGVISLETGINSKTPNALAKYEEKALYEKACYIAKLAAGENV